MPPVVRPVAAVPRRMRQICAVTAAVVLVAMLADALLLTRTEDGVISFGAADQLAVAGIGVVLAAGILLLGRPRVDADADGVRVRNVLGSHALPWAVVESVRFERKSAWAGLQLVTGEVVSVLAVQALDKERAVAAVEGLRDLLAASRAGAGRAAGHRE